MHDESTVRSAIETLKDPVSGKSFKETGAVKFVSVEKDAKKVNVVVALDVVDDKTKATMTRQLAKVVKIDLGFSGLSVDYQLAKLEKSILGRHDGPMYIGIASGKGGVGKSTVAANLALALTRIGKKIGIIDADIYGSSIPTLFDLDAKAPKATEDKKMMPPTSHGVQIMSTGFFLEGDKPVMWRGPMLGKMLNHFFYDTQWDEEIDIMLIDLPPGTGDVAIDIQKLIPACKMLIVTTPHKSASRVAIKAGYAARELKHDVIGVVENMSHLEHDGERLMPFGEGGGEDVAKKLDTRVVANIPLAQPKDGHHSLFSMEEDTGVIYLGLANRLIKTLA